MDLRSAATLVVCLVVAARHVQTQRVEEGCGQPADFVFVLDVSSSIWEVDFRDHVLQFVKYVVERLDVGPGPNRTRVAAITFSTGVRQEFFLYQHMKKKRLLQAVLKIRTRGGDTNTHKALKYVDKTVLQPSNGARSNVSHIVIVITDGVSHKAEATRETAKVLRDHGAVIFAIGVGLKKDRQQLADMASSPASHYVFEVTNFAALAKIKDKLVGKACEVETTTTTTTTTTTPATTTPQWTTPTPKRWVSSTAGIGDRPVNDRPLPDENDGASACEGRYADIYFVLDSSSSIWEEHFRTNMLGFVRDVINLYDVGIDRTRVGLITYSDAAHKIFGLTSHPYKDELNKAVKPKNVPYTPGVTNTDLALQEAGYQLEQEGRAGVEQVLILITDGQSKDPDSTVATARALRHMGVRLLAVGIGQSVDEKELRAISGEETVMMVGDFESLSLHSTLLAALSCSPGATAPELPVNDASSNYCRLGQADVIFVYDWSSLGSDVVFKIVTTLRHLTTLLHARGADVKLGTMTSRACLSQQPVPLSDSDVFRKYTRGGVRSQLHRVLKTVRDSGFSSSNGHRSEARKVAVVVLDATNASILRKVATEAARMRHDGVEIWAVTSGQRGEQLAKGIASGPVRGHVIPVPYLDFSNAAFVSDLVASILCGDNQFI